MAGSRQFSPAVSPDIAAAASMLETVPEVHLLDRLAVVFKHLRLIAAVFAIVVSLAMLEYLVHIDPALIPDDLVGWTQTRLVLESLKDNGDGKTQLCVSFQTGSAIVLATEA